jgi:hypothetical protein
MGIIDLEGVRSLGAVECDLVDRQQPGIEHRFLLAVTAAPTEPSLH